MLITDILIVVVMLVHWKLNVGLVALFLVLFGTIDLTFVCANFTKVLTPWLPAGQQPSLLPQAQDAQ